MMPATVHAVYTFNDCFCQGGHFYHTGNLEASLHALAIEHAAGLKVTNTQHPHAPIFLFKLLRSFLGMAMSSSPNRPENCECLL